MSVARAQEEIDSAEFTQWVEFYAIEPFGTERLALELANVQHTMAMLHSTEKTKLKDFLLDFGGTTEKKVMSGDEMIAVMDVFMGINNQFHAKRKG